MTEAIVAGCSAVVALATVVFGYMKLARASRVATIEDQIVLAKDRITYLETSLDEVKHELAQVHESERLCQEERTRLERQRTELLLENRELKSKH